MRLHAKVIIICWFAWACHAAVGDQLSELTLAENGAARARILLPAEPSALETYAAMQLAQAMEKMTGAHFDIDPEDSKSTGTDPLQPIVSIGRTHLAGDIKMAGPQAWMLDNPEAFRIVRRNNALFICGNTSGPTPDFGTIRGVYKFLQMQGFGSYMNGEPLGIVYPEHTRLAIGELDVTDAPWFEMRGHDDTIADYLTRAGDKPGDLIGFDGLGAFERMEYNHSYQRIASAEVRKAHPEWFAGTHNSIYGPQPGDSPPIGWGLPNNGICLSRPEIRNLFMEYFKKRFHDNPDLKVATICPDDYNLGYRCDCSECMRLINLGDRLNADTQQRSASDLHIDFVNAVAKGLEKDFPDRKLITYAYIDYINAPKKTRVHPNVIVMIVGYWNNSTPEMDKVIHDWHDMGAQSIYWYGWILNRPPIPHRLGEWYRNFKRQGVRGVYMEYSAVPIVNMINGWLAQKLAWNPNADVGALLDEYFFGLFGPDVGLQMRRFFVAAWEMNPPETDAIPGLLAAATKMAGDDPSSVIAQRVRFFKLGYEIYHSAYELDAALKAADIARARDIVTSAVDAQHALEKQFPWSLKEDVWLYNTAIYEYSVTVLPALQALLNTTVQMPAPQPPLKGPLLCFTNNADLARSERAGGAPPSVVFDTQSLKPDTASALFDGKLADNGVGQGLALPGFAITMDFGASFQIDYLEVCAGLTKARWETVPIYTEVQLSNDGTTFVPVDRILPRTLKGYARSATLLTSARYIRLWTTSLNMNHDINEIRVWGRRANR